MKLTSRMFVLAAAAALTASAAQAQGGQRPGRGTAAASGPTKEQREARRDANKERVANLTPEQREAAKAAAAARKAERERLDASMKAGTMTKEQAHDAMEAWIKAHPPAAKPEPKPDKKP